MVVWIGVPFRLDEFYLCCRIVLIVPCLELVNEIGVLAFAIIFLNAYGIN